MKDQNNMEPSENLWKPPKTHFKVNYPLSYSLDRTSFKRYTEKSKEENKWIKFYGIIISITRLSKISLYLSLALCENKTFIEMHKT